MPRQQVLDAAHTDLKMVSMDAGGTDCIDGNHVGHRQVLVDELQFPHMVAGLEVADSDGLVVLVTAHHLHSAIQDDVHPHAHFAVLDHVLPWLVLNRLQTVRQLHQLRPGEALQEGDALQDGAVGLPLAAGGAAHQVPVVPPLQAPPREPLRHHSARGLAGLHVQHLVPPEAVPGPEPRRLAMLRGEFHLARGDDVHPVLLPRQLAHLKDDVVPGKGGEAHGGHDGIQLPVIQVGEHRHLGQGHSQCVGLGSRLGVVLHLINGFFFFAVGGVGDSLPPSNPSTGARVGHDSLGAGGLCIPHILLVDIDQGIQGVHAVGLEVGPQLFPRAVRPGAGRAGLIDFDLQMVVGCRCLTGRHFRRRIRFGLPIFVPRL
mmetsp:Transcript_85168/g.149042  ORF Transcript_85168/g.149042 Transcript_85168/m.149042 type:complete len:373 (-) Transcript_85168:144-1262(-)